MRKKRQDEVRCSNCGEKIEVCDYRISLVGIEYRFSPPNGVQEPSRRLLGTYCDLCIASLPEFRLYNPWRLRVEVAAADARGSHDPKDDIMESGRVSLECELQRDADSERDGVPPRLDEILPYEGPIVETQGDRERERRRLHRFLAGVESKGIPKQVRKVAEMWASGKTQQQIAGELKISQAKVSRMMKTAKLLYSRLRRENRKLPTG